MFLKQNFQTLRYLTQYKIKFRVFYINIFLDIEINFLYHYNINKMHSKVNKLYGLFL